MERENGKQPILWRVWGLGHRALLPFGRVERYNPRIMLPRFHAKDFSTVGHYLGVLLVITGSLMFVPVIVAALFGERAQIPLFVFGAGLTLLVGSLLRLLRASQLDRRRSLLLCGFGWVLIALFAAVPMYLSDEFTSFVAAFFDSVSMLTSTGVTCLPDVEHMSHAQSTWRTVLSLAGGQAIIITALYLGFFGDGGYSARDNARARHDSITTALRSTGKLVWSVMAALVVVGLVAIAVVLFLDGMPLGDALANGFWLAGNAFSTGSFVPHNSSLIFYHSTTLNSFVAVLMLLGSLNFAIFGLAVTRTSDARRLLVKNSELRSYALWLLFLVAAVTAIICREGVFTGMASLFNHSTFMLVSAATTSGMQTVYPGQMGETFPDGALILIMAAMFIGGCSCSTAGGLKMFRALQVLRWFGQSVQRSLFPDSVQVYARYNHFGTKRATSEDAQLAMVVTTMFIIAAAMGSAVFIAHGYDAVDAICESISYVTNTGVAVERGASSMDYDLMLISMLMMWAGRLEFIALIAAFASVVTSARPHRNVIPDGVVSSRKGQHRERRRKLAGKLRRLLRFESGAAKGVAVIVAISLAGMAIGVPQAAQARTAASDSSGQFQMFSGHRESTVEELQSATSRMDGDYVKITGEVVGYAVKADDKHVWLNLQGESGSVISVLATNRAASQITQYGCYEATGDRIAVSGIYNQACGRHAGELEVHATSVDVEQAGTAIEHEGDYFYGSVGTLMLLISFILTVLERLWRGKRYLRILGLKL